MKRGSIECGITGTIKKIDVNAHRNANMEKPYTTS
jgi:hypothetical protein